MNIFALDNSPILSAHYHCDQHLSKMLLESAQMLSTAYHSNNFDLIHVPDIYKPAYQGHPCTIWTCSSVPNMNWVITLCQTLEEIRLDVGMNPHQSMVTILQIRDVLAFDFPSASWETHLPFALAMPAHIKYKSGLSAVERYRLYYQFKSKQWHLTKGTGMKYSKGRVTPAFMTSLTP